jgi:hypothetical protein
VMSVTNPGQPASVDEALAHLITDPRMLKADNASGGGSDPAAGGGNGKIPAKHKKLSEMTVPEKVAFVKEHGEEAFQQALED